jgi:hypothetical protein
MIGVKILGKILGRITGGTPGRFFEVAVTSNYHLA